MLFRIAFTTGIIASFFSCRDLAPPLPFSAKEYSITKKITVKNAAVVSAHPLASEVGKMILQNGGNAFDAAIAVQLALAVVYPEAGNIGGGGFLVGRTAAGKNIALDYRETAPGGAHSRMYIDKNGNVDSVRSLTGNLSSGVPGTVAGLFAAMKYAKLNFTDLINPAIALAENGFAITERQANDLNRYALDLDSLNEGVTALVKKEGWKAGDLLVQKDLALTLSLIRDYGMPGFYEGATAQRIVEEMKRGPGIITMEDLKNYRCIERTPITFGYKGDSIISMPFPSSGGLILNMLMKMGEKENWKEKKFHSLASVHLMTEMEKMCYSDRSAHMGDPDFIGTGNAAYIVESLTGERYLDERRKSIRDGRMTPCDSVFPCPDMFPPSQPKEETTHLSIIDAEGNAVAVTTTINGSFGSRVVVRGAGFLLNNEMDDFSAKPGYPNYYGLVGSKMNSIAPHKRMLSSMTPTIVVRKGKPFIVIGTPGGSTIITSVYQALMNILEFDMDLGTAINAPKFHHQWKPDKLFVESDFPLPLRDSLSAMGYNVVQRPPIGRTDGIMVMPDGSLVAVGDKRGDDSAAGF